VVVVRCVALRCFVLLCVALCYARRSVRTSTVATAFTAVLLYGLITAYGGKEFLLCASLLFSFISCIQLTFIESD
jgi:hypothetical protein